MTEYPFIERLEYEVADHGEVHAVVEEHDREIDIRAGTATFDYGTETIRIEDGPTDQYINMDSIVRYYKPVDL